MLHNFAVIIAGIKLYNNNYIDLGKFCIFREFQLKIGKFAGVKEITNLIILKFAG